MTLEWHGFRPAQRVWCPAYQKAGTVPTEREARALFLNIRATGVPVRFDGSGDISDVPPEYLSATAPVTAELRFHDPLGTVNVTVDLCQLIQPGRDFDLDWGTRMIVGEAVRDWANEDDGPKGIEWQDAAAGSDAR